MNAEGKSEDRHQIFDVRLGEAPPSGSDEVEKQTKISEKIKAKWAGSLFL